MEPSSTFVAAAPSSAPSPYPPISTAAAIAADASSMPLSPVFSAAAIPRPASAMVRPPRSSSCMSVGSKNGGSHASDEDSRTSVKVVVRVRPPLRPTDPGYDLIPQRFQRSMVSLPSSTNLSIESPQGRKLFVFDRVFGPDVGQDGIWEYLADSIESFTTGYNVSLLAYGQSGAGKSYTMGTSGPIDHENVDVMGVIPRAATALFEKLEGPRGNAGRGSFSHLRTPKGYGQPLPKVEKNWSLKATYVEIYNEQLRDLLVTENVPTQERATVTIREDVKGNILLTGLRQIDINSVDDLMHALDMGSTVRQTDATAINARSSRSHAVFSLNLVQRKAGGPTSKAEKRMSVPVESMSGTETWVTIDSKLHFVDLAGSERLKNTGAQGERAKEGISINGGLAALGKVISQLSSRHPGSHVSYRDSRLTRLLQDSLGGNAITYMIACVTPAEFHLSETLNTVQYAQRARAIQSKPRILQMEEGDKQAIIDRLKAEVTFLREQIRSSASSGPGGDRRVLSANERSERQGEREVELQNALLDAQENYTALSQRHAKLISEMARARDNEAAVNQLAAANAGDSADERIDRSNSFAQAVEQVVLEYEKTIQSLEQSLSNTRATLSGTETTLLEKETKCAYVETINSQLQARLQKLMDREMSTENYLHDLEAKLDGHTSGEEKNATIIIELRKEISRLRENEVTCEDYISTLEERLAEADQDAELMQREIDRLEQVIERQRSLGKLDSLLYELDNMQQDEATEVPIDGPDGSINGMGHRHRRTNSRNILEHARTQSHVRRLSHSTEVIPEEEDMDEQLGVMGVNGFHKNGSTMDSTPEDSSGEADEQNLDVVPTEKFMEVSQELIDLRVEHESTLGDLESMQQKYESAMRALAELQDSFDEARHANRTGRDSMLSVSTMQTVQTRPPSMLLSEPPKNVRYIITSRSLSSELSSAMDSPTIDHLDTGTLSPKSKPPTISTEPASVDIEGPLDSPEAVGTELKRLRGLASRKWEGELELAQKYAHLEQQHHQTLDLVEELKTEVVRAQQAAEVMSPRSTTPVIRRKSSQNVMSIDRVHRSFASLRNIAAENFENNPDVMQSFELNLNVAVHELHARLERIQELEAGVTSAKKEMETKMAIISGLTRERTSLKSSPMEISLASTLRDQLEKNEQQMREMQEAYTARETELQAEVEALRNASSGTATIGEHDDKVRSLQEELEGWKAKHKTALETMSETEKQMKEQIAQLVVKVAEHEKALTEYEQSLEALQTKHAEEVESLRATLQKEFDDEVQVLMSEHSENIRILESDLTEAREDLMKVATQVAFALGMDVSVERVSERIEELISAQRKNVELRETVTELRSISDSAMQELEAARTGLLAILGPDADQAQKPGTTVADQLALVQKRMTDMETRSKKNSRLVDELEEQLQTNFDQAQITTNRLSTLQSERNQQLEEANAAKIRMQAELETIREEYAALQARVSTENGPQRSNSRSGSVVALPSPPPAIPLPPLPGPGSPSLPAMRPASRDIAAQQIQQDQEARIRTIEKHLDAEKQLTQTLEEALTDLEEQSNKMKADCEAWRQRCGELEVELKELKERPQDTRWSLHQVEEERKKRRDAEIARAHLEERMNAISKKKKKGSLNCF